MKKYIAEKKENKELNGVELYFSVYPLDGTKETLKKNGFRWNRKKSCWYAKKSADTDNIATLCAETAIDEYKEIAEKTGETVREVGKTAQKTKKTTKKAVKEEINLDGLGENAPHLHGAELAAAIRADLKKRGVKGVTVRAKRVTYETGITVTIKATADDIASIEEAKERYPYHKFSCDACNYHGIYTDHWLYENEFECLTDAEKEKQYNIYIERMLKREYTVHRFDNDSRNDQIDMTAAFFNKVSAVYKIANQWNYNHSDSMTDYFDVGYYLDIDIKKPADFEPRKEMTEKEKADYAEEIRLAEEKRAAELAEYERQQEENRKAWEEAEKKWQADEKLINENIEVVYLKENEQIYITNLIGGAGKEINLDELNKTIESGHALKEDALITRKVIFKTKETYEAFTRYLCNDFDFLAGMGGTGSDDVRLEGVKAMWQLNEEQRQSVKWYLCNCVAIYCGDKLELICDPQGYNYSRYTYRLSGDSQILTAKTETDRQKTESESKTAFYFPDTVEKQAENLEIGQEITVYQCDGWILNSIYSGFGTIKNIEKGDYAQHKGGIWITLKQGRKKNKVFIRDGKQCLIYAGIKPKLPDNVTRREISRGNDCTMYEMFNYDQLFPNVLEYYGKQGEKPLIDTIQR